MHFCFTTFPRGWRNGLVYRAFQFVKRHIRKNRRKRSRDGAHLPASRQACFSIPLPKLCMILSHHTAFHHDRCPTLVLWTRESMCRLVITGIHVSPAFLSIAP